MARNLEYGEGSVYQRCDAAKGCPPAVVGPDGKRTRPGHDCRGMWVGSLSKGWNANGTRRRIVVYGKTEKLARRRLEVKTRELEVTGQVVSDKVTVKQWAEKYLELRVDELRPKAYNAAASPIGKWIIPTIGHKRMAHLTAEDIRSLDKAQYNHRSKRYPNGLKSATADATRRVLYTMLRRAEAEGHKVPSLVYLVPRPGSEVSDRMPLTIADTVKMLFVSSTVPHGVRWLLALLYGPRQAEVLGLIEESLDFEVKEIHLEWQLQALPYIDNADKSLGFRVPRNYEVRHVDRAFHLVRPKSKKGIRVLPMEPEVERALKAWLPKRPKSTCENDLGLLFPLPDGKPKPDYTDRREWWRLQEQAGVMHPGGERPYHIHECRNFAATTLDRTEASETVITSLLGHATIGTSRRYMRADAAAKSKAVGAVLAELRAAGWDEPAPE